MKDIVYLWSGVWTWIEMTVDMDWNDDQDCLACPAFRCIKMHHDASSSIDLGFMLG